MRKKDKSLNYLKNNRAKLTPWEQAVVNKKNDQNNKIHHFGSLNKQSMILLICFGIIFIVSFFFILPFNRVLSLKVYNTKDTHISKSVIRSSNLHIYESVVPIWLHDSSIERNIKEKVPSISNVDVVNHYGHIRIYIKEYPTIGYIVKHSKYYYVLSSGTISQYSTTNLKGKLPIFYGFYNKHILKGMVLQFDKLPSKVKEGISEIHFSPTKVDSGRIKLYMNDGNQVIATISTFAQKMQYYPGIVSKMNYTGVIDLEVGAFSYPYGKN